MEIRKFTAPTEAQALLQAKEEMGMDLVIMNVRTIQPKGIKRLFQKPEIEVTVALDEPRDQTKELFDEIRQIQKKHEKKEDSSIEPTQKIDISYDQNEMFEDSVRRSEARVDVNKDILEEGLESIHGKMEQQRKEQQNREIQNIDYQRNDYVTKEVQNSEQSMTESIKAAQEKDIFDDGAACISLIRKQLAEAEIQTEYIDQLIDEIQGVVKKDTSVDYILAGIYQKIILKLGHPQTIRLTKQKCKYVFFVGPTGVGKTTTIAKIASSFHLKKKVRTAMVTSDTYRIAAVEQLKTYANIMGIPITVAYTPEEMEQIPKQYKDFDLVLVDTAGRSHKDPQQTTDVLELIRKIPEGQREIYLVLSATTKYRDLVKITKTYEMIGEYRLIFTKLDETDEIGNLFNLRMLTGKDLSYATWGQNVPEDIGVVNPQKIAKQLLGGNE